MKYIKKIEIKDNNVSFTGVRGIDNAKFAVDLELFGSVDSEMSKINVGDRDVSLVLVKSESGPFWPRLLKSTCKMHYIHTDFSKWVDEDEEEEVEGKGNGNFDMSQFGGAGGSNFDMSQFGGDAENFDGEEQEEFEGEEDEQEEEEEEDNCSHENCSHSHSEGAKMSGLTKNNESFDA